ncbi:MAG TPA: hypothetical protein VGQ83_36320 [Polyangia bacterium]|jgi:hypothetical protein
MRRVLSFLSVTSLLVGAVAAAAEPPAPAPLHKVHVDQGFIDDALAVGPNGDQLAYVHTDGDKSVLVIERLGGAPAKVTAPLTGLPPAIAKLAFSADGKLVLVVGDDREHDLKVGQLFTVEGKPHRGKLPAATDYDLAAVGGTPVVMALTVTSGKRGTSYTITAYKLADLKVLKKKVYTQDKHGLITGLDLHVVSYADAYQRVIGQRKGEFDKKNDVRKPENIAVVEALTGKILGQTEITDPIAWAEVAKLRAERPALEAFLVVEELKTLILVDREHKKTEIKVPVPMHRYEPKTLLQRLIGTTLYFSFSVDPVNPDITAKGRTDRPDVDFYALDLAGRTAKRLFRLASDRPVAWTIGAGRLAVLRKYKNFSRGGLDLEVYPLPTP